MNVETSIIIPTIKGREEYLKNCLASYARTTENYEAIVVPDKAVCGAAWLEGAEKAQGRYIHFSADDLRPHPGWFQAAVEVVERGYLPAPRILNDDGTLQSCGGTSGWNTEKPTGEATDFSRIPFLSREQWGEIRPLVEPFLSECHYYTDNAISYAGGKSGISTGVHRNYLFSHSLAEPGRGAGMTWEKRMWEDWKKFLAWQNDLQPYALL